VSKNGATRRGLGEPCRRCQKGRGVVREATLRCQCCGAPMCGAHSYYQHFGEWQLCAECNGRAIEAERRVARMAR